ncbi:MAG: hypothetical protein ABR503_15190 [Chitinophagaceae bacterium]
MSNRSTDTLFQLIHSLQKWEKRNFKLYVKRNSSNDDLRVVQLFDALERMKEYDEPAILKKNPLIKKQQLSNIKAHLYRQLLASLRILEGNENIDIQLHEQLDHARILYNKGLYLQSLRTLDKIKETAKSHNQISFLTQVLFLEKKIETLHITRSLEDRANQLAEESVTVNKNVYIINELSNLALLLYSWYIKNGHARNNQDEITLTDFFKKHLTADLLQVTTFYQKLYLYQCYCWYAFIRQDYLQYYRYTHKWVELFNNERFMIKIETAHYIKGLHNLLNAHFNLSNYKKFDETLAQFEEFATSSVVQQNDNNNVQVFVYLYLAKINKHFMYGTFKEGLELVPFIEDKLEEYSLYLDRHRVLIFYYKIASLYFGDGNFDKAIDYLNKIINWKIDLRSDIQCYSRLLHLIAHYEIGNFDIMEYLIKSVYRFMSKMESLSTVEEEIFSFLRKSFNLSVKELVPAFEELLHKLKQLQKNQYEVRAFSYLDFISWLESKIYNIPVHSVIRNKYLKASSASRRSGIAEHQ